MERSVCVVGDLVRIDTVRKSDDGLHVCATGRAWESSAGSRVAILRPSTVAPPCDSGDLLVDVRLAYSGRIPSHGMEVVGEWDLSMIDLLIVGLERSGVDLGVGVTVYIIQSRRPLISFG